MGFRFLLVTVLLAASCSHQPLRRDDSVNTLLPIDSVALSSFVERVAERYRSDSAASSFHVTDADSVERPLPGPFSPTSRFRLNGSFQDTVVITLCSFDKQDSCTLYHGLLPSKSVEFDIGRTDLPTGIYILRTTTKTNTVLEKRFFLLR